MNFEERLNEIYTVPELPDELSEKYSAKEVDRCKEIAHKLRPLFLSIEETTIASNLGKLEVTNNWY